MSQTHHLRELVTRAHHELFTLHDITALERFFSPAFIEHSPLVTNGLKGLRELVEAHPSMLHDPYRVLVDADLVAIHGRFTGLDTQPLVGFDLYRVQDKLIVEHWDGLVPQAAPNASGRTQLDGPVDPGIGHVAEQNRALVVEFFNRCLIQSDYEAFRAYTADGRLLQHSPDIADGTDAVIAFLDQLRSTGQGLHYNRLHRTVAEGQFVLTHSEGSISGQRHAYFELWRVENGKIAELWDAITPVPEDNAALHDHGIF